MLRQPSRPRHPKRLPVALPPPVPDPITLRAPQEHRQGLFHTSHSLRCHDPQCVARHHATPGDRLQQLWQTQQHRSATLPQLPWAGSVHAAREELYRLAQRWTQQYAALPDEPTPTQPLSHSDGHGDSDGDSDRPWVPAAPATTARPLPLFLSGHQPEWFHPGVWYKNFVLHAAARATRSIGINLLVDQDLVKTNTLVVPADDDGRVYRRRIPLDYGGVGLPYQERQLEHPDLVASAPARVQAAAASWVDLGLLHEVWPAAYRLGRELRGGGYGCAAARHLAEQRVGCHNLEVPLSWACETRSFAQFVVMILADLESFVTGYNQAVAEYRQWYQIRSPQRPLPDLWVQDAWHELPLWLWTAQQPWRKRVAARRTPTGWQLSVIESQRVQTQDWQLDLDQDFAVEQILGFAALQVRLRPRALLTTLYSRAILSDTFLHGLGGALYDQMTDRIARLLWQVDLPDYAIATATWHVTDTTQLSTLELAGQATVCQRYLRDLHFAPERIPDFATRYPQWVADKQQLLRDSPPRGQRHRWQEKIQQLLNVARHTLQAEIAQTQLQCQSLQAEVARHRLQRDREWSLLLYPTSLPQQLHDLAQTTLATPTLSRRGDD